MDRFTTRVLSAPMAAERVIVDGADAWLPARSDKRGDAAGAQDQAYRVWADDPATFSTHKIAALHHNFHEHPLFQVAELAQLAKELVPFNQCRFVRPGISQASSFAHDSRHPDGKEERDDRNESADSRRHGG